LRVLLDEQMPKDLVPEASTVRLELPAERAVPAM
jgi:hypothetical protein